MRISELGMLDIINVSDGRRLGPVADWDIDLERGVIKGIIIAGGSRGIGLNLFGGGRSQEITIPWGRIKKIGVEVILVDDERCTELVRPGEEK